MHPRVGLHQVAFLRESTAGFMAFCRANGFRHMTLVTPILMKDGDAQEAGEALYAAAGLQVATVNHPFAVYPDLENDSGEAVERMLRAIDIAGSLDAPTIYMQTGGRGTLSWEAAADRLAELLAPCKAAAAAKGITLMIENASAFNIDMHIAHTLADTILLAERLGLAVCIDLQPSWGEAGLERLFRQALPITRLVQVSDYVLGDRTAPCRAVPGDGAVPLERLIGDLLDAGYAGVFDLELVGPRIGEEGPAAASIRAGGYLSELLTRLGT